MSLLLLFACKAGEDSAEPTFSSVDAALVRSCGLSSCHGSGSGDLEIDGEGDYEALVGVASADAPEQTLVVPGDSELSYLVWKLEGRAGIVGEPMPPPAGGMDEATLGLIRAWIDAGALPD